MSKEEVKQPGRGHQALFGYCYGGHDHEVCVEWVLWCFREAASRPSIYEISMFAFHECPSLHVGPPQAPPAVGYRSRCIGCPEWWQVDGSAGVPDTILSISGDTFKVERKDERRMIRGKLERGTKKFRRAVQTPRGCLHRPPCASRSRSTAVSLEASQSANFTWWGNLIQH